MQAKQNQSALKLGNNEKSEEYFSLVCCSGEHRDVTLQCKSAAMGEIEKKNMERHIVLEYRIIHMLIN